MSTIRCSRVAELVRDDIEPTTLLQPEMLHQNFRHDNNRSSPNQWIRKYYDRRKNLRFDFWSDVIDNNIETIPIFSGFQFISGTFKLSSGNNALLAARP